MQFAADMQRLKSMLDYVRAEAEQAGFDEEEVNKIELAAEEVLVNIIYYAYTRQPVGDIEIRCASSAPRVLEMIFSDHGPPFNPLESQPVDRNAPLEQRKVGGLGVFFVQQLMDSVTYRRDGNRNVLTLVKKGSS